MISRYRSIDIMLVDSFIPHPDRMYPGMNEGIDIRIAPSTMWRMNTYSTLGTCTYRFEERLEQPAGSLWLNGGGR